MIEQTDMRRMGVFLYIVAAFLTFGHIFNAYFEPPVDCGDMPEVFAKGWDGYWDCRAVNIATERYVRAAFPAVLSGIAWPLYWAGSIAIKVTK